MAKTESSMVPGYADKETWRVLGDNGSEYTVETDPGRWAQVKVHPRSIAASKKLGKSHWELARKARGPALAHLKYVVAAEFEGEIYKVDGSTRGLMWVEGTLPAPEKVIVTVFRCNDRQSLNELYSAYQHHGSAETMYERVQGAYHENELNLTSHRLRGGTIVDALHIARFGITRPSKAEKIFDVYEAVSVFADELQALDELKPRADLFHSGVVAAALIGLRVSRSNAAFFEAIAKRKGSKKDGLKDPVENTLDYIEKFKDRKTAWIKDNQVTLASRTLAAMDIYNQGEASPAFWNNKAPPQGSLSDRVAKLHETQEE